MKFDPWDLVAIPVVWLLWGFFDFISWIQRTKTSSELEL